MLCVYFVLAAVSMCVTSHVWQVGGPDYLLTLGLLSSVASSGAYLIELWRE
jgi:hypothetical protein